ncbi:MAG TPA: lysyl oxidase family protein, partial [Polyangiaceae bacterium]|nr:lysyl oxidase family protein [Polyangiaceae bacterium]
PTLLSHCSTEKDGASGDGNPSGSAGSVSSSGSGGSPSGGRASGGAGGTTEAGRSMGGAAGTATASAGGGSGGSAVAGSAGAPIAGFGGVAGSSEGGQAGSAIAGGGGGGRSGGNGGQAGAGGNPGGSGGKANGGASGVGGSGGASGVGGRGGAGGGSGSGGFSCAMTCGAGMMCCPSSALATSCIPQTSAGCLAADLTVSVERARDTAEVVFRNFAANHCALAEQCIGASGRRRLLRFETYTPNIGTADMRLGVPNTSNPVFEYSACHDHFHFKGYAEYDLLDANGTVVASGHKQAFCLLDSERFLTTDNTVRRTPQFDCGNQGITRGWGDSYTPDLDCQWVDVTDVPPGDYQLRIRINQSHALLELRYDNNEALVPVRIP